MPETPSSQNLHHLQSMTCSGNLVRWGSVLLFLLLIGWLSGCADHSARSKELLAQNYQTLADDDLTLYYYELEDQINVVERGQNNSSLSFGLGIGSYSSGRGSSGGVGVTTHGNQSGTASNLRDRRNEVKLEMKKRGLKP